MKTIYCLTIVLACGFSTGALAKKKKKAVKKAVASSTDFDFEETMLDGKMKAPTGMMLKGRVQQRKTQMVNLRKDFRSDLSKSRAAVRSIRP